jgi:hypothetical protein
MGYNLAIGQATVYWDPEYLTIDVDTVELDDAPAYDEPTDNKNIRWPSYSGWAHVCRELDIEDIMGRCDGNDSGITVDGKKLSALMPEHPGTAPIVQGHYDYIKKKVDRYKMKHKGVAAGYPKDGQEDAGAGGVLVRAEWLLFWLKWALDNCDKPIFYNS